MKSSATVKVAIEYEHISQNPTRPKRCRLTKKPGGSAKGENESKCLCVFKFFIFMGLKPENCLKRPHLTSISVRRECLQDARKARLEVNEDMMSFATKAVEERSRRILRRRDRRIAAGAAQTTPIHFGTGPGVFGGPPDSD